LRVSREAHALNYIFSAGPRLSLKPIVGFVLPFGRTALQLIARDLKRRDVHRVYVPGLICDVVPEALKKENIEIKYYPIQESFEPDFDWLEKNFSQGAFLYVNYFGLSNTCRSAAAWAKQRNLIVIADNAHGALGELQEAEFADYSFTSIGKAVGLRYGAILRVPHESKNYIESQIGGMNLRVEASCLLSSIPGLLENILRPKKQEQQSDVTQIEKKFD
jgi:hypothetical protein